MKTITVTVSLSGFSQKRIPVSDQLYEELQERISSGDDNVHAWSQQFENSELNDFSGNVLELAEYPDLGNHHQTEFDGLEISFEEKRNQATQQPS